MKEQMITDALLREFLLGKVSDAERERIEDLFLTDSQVRERVLTAEQDLIEDYLEDSLTSAERERFLLQYAQTPEQRTKLKITKSIKDFALTKGGVTQFVPSSISIWDRLRAWLRPVFVVPIAVAIIIAIVVAVWVNRIERNRYLAIEQELARLNDPASLREVPPQMISRNLSPVAVRSVAEQNQIKKDRDVWLVELRLPWIRPQRYSSYSVVVRRVDGDESFTIPNIQVQDNASQVIQIRLPAHILHKGLYRVELIGIAADGSRSEVEEYNFTVTD